MSTKTVIKLKKSFDLSAMQGVTLFGSIMMIMMTVIIMIVK